MIGVAIVLLFVFVIDPFGLFKPKQTIAAPKATVSELASLKSAYAQDARPASQYVAGLFKSHEIVMIGELGRISQQVDFVASLIPDLYKAGVSNLGTEYALAADQKEIDRVLTAPTYDARAVDQILFDRMVIWGFKEYADLFHAAWQFNQTLARGERPFRIVGLSVVQEYQYLKTQQDATNPEIVKKVMTNGIPDVFMAQVIQKEFIDRGEKALVYMSFDHIFTTYRNKQYTDRGKAAGILNTERTGNIVYDKIGAKVFSVCLHSPWSDQNSLAYPVGGAIDALIKSLPAGTRNAGFTLAGTAFGKLPVKNPLYATGDPNLTLDGMFNGYVILGPLSEYRAVTPIPDFINAANLATAITYFPGPNIPSTTTAQDLNNFIANMSKNMNVTLKRFN